MEKVELDNYDYFLMREQDERGKVELAENKKALEMQKFNKILHLKNRARYQ